MTSSSGYTPVLLPEQWRVTLMMNPELLLSWSSKVRAVGLEFLDWEGELGPALVVAAIDPSTVEAILKLPASVKCIAIDLRLTRRFMFGGVRGFEKRALDKKNTVLVQPGCERELIWDSPDRYFDLALGCL